MLIEEILYIDNIFKIEKNMSEQVKKPVTNLSYWNPSKTYIEMMLKAIEPQSIETIFEYVYTYDVPISKKNSIIEKITGKQSVSQMCLIMPNGTLSILNLINYLKLNNYRRLFIVQPSYFSVEEACKLAGLEIVNLSYVHNFKLSLEVFKGARETDAIWITSPIYSTSYLLDQSIMQTIDQLTSHDRLVIIDESLNINGLETIRSLKQNKNLIGIYSPHKALFLNSFKFSVIICDKSYDDFLEQWVDIMCGSLPGSCLCAVEHFLSSNYDLCNQKARAWFKTSKAIIDEVLKRYPFAKTDTGASVGSYVTISIPNSPLMSLDFINRMISQTLVSIIPSFLKGGSTCSFRINLSLDHYIIGNSLSSLLEFVSQQIP